MNRRLAACVLLGLLAACGESQRELPPSAQLLIEARKAIASGDQAAAVDALTRSIESQPNLWAYFERARLLLLQGQDAEARADCEAAQQLDPENQDIAWLLGEIAKPASNRFKGKHSQPPSYAK